MTVWRRVESLNHRGHRIESTVFFMRLLGDRCVLWGLLTCNGGTPMHESQHLARWVDQHRQQIGFGLQVFPTETRSDPARALLAAGRLAEELRFDAFFFGD